MNVSNPRIWALVGGVGSGLGDAHEGVDGTGNRVTRLVGILGSDSRA